MPPAEASRDSRLQGFLIYTNDRTDAFAHTDGGVAVAYQRRGAGRPLVLLAGQANNHHWWEGVREDFHDTHSTITLDYRGSPGGLRAVERDASVRRALAQPDPDAVRQTLTGLMYSPNWLAEHPGPYGTLGDPHMPAHAKRGHLVASNEHDAWDALPSIGAPTLILHGDQDRLTPPENVGLLAARIPDTRTHLFPGARHAYFEECRGAAGALTREFLH